MSERIKAVLLFISIALVFSFTVGISYGDEKEENLVKFPKNEQGVFVIKKGTYLAIPEDMRIRPSEGNVVTVEGVEEYFNRKHDDLAKRLDKVELTLAETLEEIRKELKEIKESLPSAN